MEKLKVIKMTTLCQNNIYLHKEIREEYNIHDGDKLLWCKDDKGRLTLRKAEIESTPSNYIDFLDKR